MIDPLVAAVAAVAVTGSAVVIEPPERVSPVDETVVAVAGKPFGPIESAPFRPVVAVTGTGKPFGPITTSPVVGATIPAVRPERGVIRGKSPTKIWSWMEAASGLEASTAAPPRAETSAVARLANVAPVGPRKTFCPGWSAVRSFIVELLAARAVVIERVSVACAFVAPSDCVRVTDLPPARVAGTPAVVSVSAIFAVERPETFCPSGKTMTDFAPVPEAVTVKSRKEGSGVLTAFILMVFAANAFANAAPEVRAFETFATSSDGTAVSEPSERFLTSSIEPLATGADADRISIPSKSLTLNTVCAVCAPTGSARTAHVRAARK